MIDARTRRCQILTGNGTTTGFSRAAVRYNLHQCVIAVSMERHTYFFTINLGALNLAISQVEAEFNQGANRKRLWILMSKLKYNRTKQ